MKKMLCMLLLTAMLLSALAFSVSAAEYEYVSDSATDYYERDAATPDGVSVEDELLLRQCLETLSESERQIVVLHAVSGLKHKDIASVMSLPLSTVLSKYSRAIKKMQAFMK